jgi:hypothetical protein
MGKKWTDETRILFEKKKELGISKLTIAYCKQYTNNKYQLVYDGSHVGFFKTWSDAFQIIDEIDKKGIEVVRSENRRIIKELKKNGEQLLCYRCNNFRDIVDFKWGHKYCTKCALEQKKDYYYLNKYEISSNKYLSYEKYFKGLISKRGRSNFITVEDLINLLKKQNYKCAITKQDFVMEKGNPKLPSIDRIVPGNQNGEYNIDNIQIIWHGLNAFKSVWSMDFIYECCEHIIKNRS